MSLDTSARLTADAASPLEQTLAAADAPEQRRRLVTSVPGPRSQALHDRRRATVPDGLGATLPIYVERAGGGILVDVDGNHVIDLASGIAVTSTGAAAPEVVDRVTEQAQRFLHTCFVATGYSSYLEVCDWLNQRTPGDHDKRTALFSTGAEAIENAVKIARTATGRSHVVVFHYGFHGRSLLTMAMTHSEVYKRGFGPFPETVLRTPYPYAFRSGNTPQEAADAAVEAFEELVTGPEGALIAAVFAESVLGEGGFLVPPPGFLSRIAAIAREHGILYVADEIQSGMGRTGDLFAIEHEGVVPDLVCTAKALAGGMPLSAVTGRAELMNSVHRGGLGGTYAGNPLACAAALGVFAMVDDADLLGRARRIGEVIREVLEPVADASPFVGELRGRGAMYALELVRPGTREPDPRVTQAIVAACHAAGVLVLTAGADGNVIRLLPPLVIGEELLRDGLGVLADAIRAVGESS